MEEFMNDLMQFEITINTKVNEKVFCNLCHNHLPLKFIVKDCEYCLKFGNVFALS